MIEDYFFLKNNVVDIDAAVVGVSKKRWKTITEEKANVEEAQKLMSQNRFDVLPITTSDEIVKEYFHTKTWNDYQSIERNQIDYDDVIGLRTPLHLLIKNFAKEEKLFYFLANETRIVGLVSAVNLNCRQVRIFIFSLISELEIRLSKFVNSKIDEAEILQEVKQETKERYLADRKKGLEPDLIEYFYLSELINLIAKNKHLYTVLGYESRNKFEKPFGKINKLRNQAAHPSRLLITSPHSIKNLWEKIEIVERCLFHLRQVGI